MIDLKTSNDERRIGVLPELAVEWLTLTQTFRHVSVIGTGTHLPLTDVQWQSALTLWTEAERNGTYAAAVNALNADAML